MNQVYLIYRNYKIICKKAVQTMQIPNDFKRLIIEMNYFTNDIRKGTAYQRQSANRTASQRLLDKHYRENHQRISQLEKELGVSSQPVKKVKLQNEQPPKETTPQQVLARVLKHLSNQNKLVKSLELTTKLFQSQGFDKISHLSILDAVMQMVQLTLSKQLQPKAYQAIKSALTIVKNKKGNKAEGKGFKQKEHQIWEILKTFGLDLSSLWTDDNFEFSRAISHLKKIISQFKVDFSNLNNIQDLKELTKLEGDEEPDCKTKLQELVNSQIQQKHLFKRSLLFSIIARLSTMGNVGWRKPIINQFLKTFNQQQKDRILNLKLKKQFNELYQNYLNSKAKSSLQQLKFNKIDKQILSTPLNSHHQVKDNRTERLVSDGAGQWSSKQN